jgi:beta-glucosidase
MDKTGGLVMAQKFSSNKRPFLGSESKQRLVVISLLMVCLIIAALQSPVLQAAPAWMDTSLAPAERAKLVLAEMTLDEKIALVTGEEKGFYVGHTPANTRLGIPELRMSDGPAGIANGRTLVTCFPAPITFAATWDVDLIRKYGTALGAEQRGKGGNTLLAPMMNIDRVPQGGRNWEGYGEDPYLSARMAATEVLGIQSQGIIATAKHFICNDFEIDRKRVDIEIDDRTLHEIYLPPFIACVKAGVGAVMGSYNLVNGTYACENADILNTILKGELGFKGWVMTDWYAAHSTVDSAKGGLDQEMPHATYYGEALQKAITTGRVPQARLDDMVQRILTSMFQMGLFDRAPEGSDTANAQSPEHTKLALDAAAQGIVLLKNSKHILPLDASKIHSIAVIGPKAQEEPIITGNGSGNVREPYFITPLQGITKRAGTGVKIRYAMKDLFGLDKPIPPECFRTPEGAKGLKAEYFDNNDLSEKPVVTKVDPNIDYDWGGDPPIDELGATNYSIRWTGKFIPPVTGKYTLLLTSDDGSRMYLNDKLLINNWGDHNELTQPATLMLQQGKSYSVKIEYYQKGGRNSVQLRWVTPTSTVFKEAIQAAQESDVAVVVVGLKSGEEGDRGSLSLPGIEDLLVYNVAKANPKTIVVVYNPAQVLMPWADEVSAILVGWIPGQEGGNALASVLFGDVNPSGRLPVTYAKSFEDYPATSAEQFPGVDLTATYSEKLLIGYRHFDANNIKPLFPFGYGLSYTTFGYKKLGVSPDKSSSKNATVTMDITNTGKRAGAEVAQLYLGFPAAAAEPPKQLKGFQKIVLTPGETKQVTFMLTPEEMSIWNVKQKKWEVVPGIYQVMVGASSRDIRLNGSFKVGDDGVISSK